MNKVFVAILCVFSFKLFSQNLKTTFEISNGLETATYFQTLDYYTTLASSSEFVKLEKKGKTDCGENLRLLIIDLDKEFDFKKAHEKGKTVMLVNNGIHPGEPDGIEASKMIARDLLENKALLENTVLAIIPVYNIGGALNRNSTSRVNQIGPKEYGFRGNGRNYDLNRDFIKADTKNARSFYEIFHEVSPDIFIDTHVSNGANYQYSITHLATQHNKLGGQYGEYLENIFTPNLESKMAAKGSEITPYVNVFNKPPDEDGFSQFMDGPRYSTGYATLFHTLGFMIETHMLKDFETRVESSYNFLETILELADKRGADIKALRKQRSEYFTAGNMHPISWKLNRSESKMIDFKGYEATQKKSEVTGQPRLYFDESKPFTKKIPYYNTFEPLNEVEIPIGYVIPQAWHEIISLLKLNKVKYHKIESDTSLNVEAYTIEKFNTSSSPYEGHYPHNRTKVILDKQELDFRQGDYIFFVDSYAGRYLVETLEPEASDSFFNWNYFDSILQQKEGFSPYVFEDVAFTLLQENEALKTRFEERKKNEPDFAENWYAQLDFIYKNSPHYEKAHNAYPVYRIVD